MIKPIKPLSGPGAFIFRATMAAMQDAEEIWGCNNPQSYLALMESIAAEACQRIVNAKHTFGMDLTTHHHSGGGQIAMNDGDDPRSGTYMMVKINPEGT